MARSRKVALAIMDSYPLLVPSHPLLDSGQDNGPLAARFNYLVCGQNQTQRQRKKRTEKHENTAERKRLNHREWGGRAEGAWSPKKIVQQMQKQMPLFFFLPYREHFQFGFAVSLSVLFSVSGSKSFLRKSGSSNCRWDPTPPKQIYIYIHIPIYVHCLANTWPRQHPPPSNLTSYHLINFNRLECFRW